MTELVDVATGQAGISMPAVRATGIEAVIVKAGGYNITPLYVSPHYAEQVDQARAAGLKVGHYFVVGHGDPTAEADFFTSHLHGFDPAHDVLVLDDERLDGNADFWTDGNAATFLRRVIAKTGVTADRVWLYLGAYNGRANVWPTVTALGIRWWVAQYGTDDGTRQAAPSVHWDVHQYTSQGRIAGYTVDRSYSPHTLDDLFGGTVALTQADINAIAKAVWSQAIKDSAGNIHQSGTFLIWGYQDAREARGAGTAILNAIQAAQPAGPPAAPGAVTPAELVAALNDPTVQAALAAAIATHLPTKITGTLTA
jgi:GH25 family lysozyme M1 (1,4-beta-N-acetylmuramidase)